MRAYDADATQRIVSEEYAMDCIRSVWYNEAAKALRSLICKYEEAGSDRHFPCVQYLALAVALQSPEHNEFRIENVPPVASVLLDTPEVQGIIRLVQFYRNDYDEKFVDNWNEYSAVLTDPFVQALMDEVRIRIHRSLGI